MTTMTQPKGSVDAVERIGSIEDPMERLKEASALVQRTKKRAEGARQLRDLATIVAHLVDGVPPVEMYRDTLHVSRGLFNRIIQRAPATLPKIENAQEQARESAEAVRRHEATIEAVRPIRDETALLLMNGGTDPVTGVEVTPMANAEIARQTGLTSARVAQVRTGTR